MAKSLFDGNGVELTRPFFIVLKFTKYPKINDVTANTTKGKNHSESIPLNIIRVIPKARELIIASITFVFIYSTVTELS